jgi:hypothetical protein
MYTSLTCKQPLTGSILRITKFICKLRPITVNIDQLKFSVHC